MKASEAPVERIWNAEEIRPFFNVRQSHKGVENQLIDMLASTGALLRGHFRLESGLHSTVFLRFADVASRLDYIEQIANELIADFERDRVTFDAVLVQQSAGRVLGEILRQKLSKRIIIAAVDNHNKATGDLINETDLYRNDKVLIVSDLSTTGTGLSTMVTSVRKRKAVPVAVALFATRNKTRMSEFVVAENVKVYAVGDFAFEKETVQEAECKLCRESEPVLSWEI